jgi:hypothetical protein
MSESAGECSHRQLIQLTAPMFFGLIVKTFMPEPDIITTVRDPEHNLKFRILAYRKLSENEAAEIIRLYLSRPEVRQNKASLRNQLITISTDIGIKPGL